jgi:hypothetical protein
MAASLSRCAALATRRSAATATTAREPPPPPASFEGDLVDGFLDLVDDHVGQLGALFAVQSLT